MHKLCCAYLCTTDYQRGWIWWSNGVAWRWFASIALPQALRASQLPKRFAKSQRQPWIAGCSSHGLCCSWRPWLCPCALPNGAALHGWTSWNLSSTHAPCPSFDPRLTSAPLIDRVPTVYSENLYEFMMKFVIIYWLWFHLHMFFKQLFWSILIYFVETPVLELVLLRAHERQHEIGHGRNTHNDETISQWLIDYHVFHVFFFWGCPWVHIDSHHVDHEIQKKSRGFQIPKLSTPW